MKLAFSIAMRFLSSSKVQTLLIVLGIAIGVSVQVFIGSLIPGTAKDLVDTTIGSSSVTITSSEEDNRVAEWESIISEIDSLDLPTELTAFGGGSSSIYRQRQQNLISSSSGSSVSRIKCNIRSIHV